MTSRRLRLAPPLTTPLPKPASDALTFPDPIEGLIPSGSICTLSGASGVGKTAFLASILPTLLAGGELFGHVVNPTKVGILVCDRPWRDHQAWFAKAGIPDIPHYSLRDVDYNWLQLRDSSRVPTLFGQLLDEINLPPGSLLLIDPLPLFLPGRLIDYKDMAIGFGLLDQQLKPRQLTALGVFHVGKQKAAKQDRYMRAQDRILGSTALIGYSETAFYLLSPDEAEKSTYEFGVISHQVPSITIEYKRTANGLFIPADELERIEDLESAYACVPDEGIHISTSVLTALIRQRCACSESTAKRLIRKLIGSKRIVIVTRGVVSRGESPQKPQ